MHKAKVGHIFLGIFLITMPVHTTLATPEKLVIAHRGASGYLPEHSLEGKALAYGMGADYLEQDLVITKDNIPIVLHDIQLDTTTDVAKKFPDRARTDGRYYAIDFTLEEIKNLKLLGRIRLKTQTPPFPNRFPVGNSSFQISTFAEEIELIQGLNQSTGRNVGIYPEIKNPAWHRQEGKDISSLVLNTLKQYGYTQKDSNAFLQSFDPNELKRIRYELKSSLKLVQLIGERRWGKPYANIDYPRMQTQEGLKEIAQYANGVGPWMQHIASGTLNPEMTTLVKDAHAAGLVVHPYTFRRERLPNYAQSLEQLLHIFYFDAGVDGVFTDFTDVAVNYLNTVK